MPGNKLRLAQQQYVHTTAELLSAQTHFNSEECRALLNIYTRVDAIGKVDRLRFRDILHTTLNITDDIMLDLIFHAFDRNNDGIVDQHEWVHGLSAMIRGTPEELIEFAYYVYDMNGDRSLAREELHHCLKGCLMPGYGVDNDEIDECERDIVEICLKKLDMDHDGQITYPDFQKAVRQDPLMIMGCGPCLPSPNDMAAFLAVITENYRDYSPVWGPFWEEPNNKKKRMSRMFSGVMSSRSRSQSKAKLSNLKNSLNATNTLLTETKSRIFRSSGASTESKGKSIS